MWDFDMVDDDTPLADATSRRVDRRWIQLRTLVNMRWWGIFGQISILMLAYWFYAITNPIGPCLLAIGAGAASNLVASLFYPRSKLLSQREACWIMTFDTLQLGAVLWMLGGLNNPFAFLIIGPLVVAAPALSLRSMIYLGATTIAVTTFLYRSFTPLETTQGYQLDASPGLFFGIYAAIVIATVFLTVYSRWIATEMQVMSGALHATQIELARTQKLNQLSGVVAATAHELGTPLATISLASGELANELSDREDLRSEAVLIRGEAERCKNILRSMGSAGMDDSHTRSTLLPALIDEAAEPHLERGKAVHFYHVESEGGGRTPPTVSRRPEIIHGLRNLVQNAVDFAEENVWVESTWSDRTLSVRVMDDGRGFPKRVLRRIGLPFIGSIGRSAARPGYQGMGLGLFIAKTLLERSGAKVAFANGSDALSKYGEHDRRVGAVVEITWPRSAIEAGAPA